MRVMVAAKPNNKRAFFQGGKLKIDGQLYSVQDLPHLPTDINTGQVCIHEKGDAICFFERHIPLSNLISNLIFAISLQLNNICKVRRLK